MAVSFSSQTSLLGFREYSPPLGSVTSGDSPPGTGSPTTSNCMTLPVLSKSVALGTPRLRSSIFAPVGYLAKSITTS